MNKDERREGATRRSGADRRAGSDTRADAEKRLAGERRAGVETQPSPNSRGLGFKGNSIEVSGQLNCTMNMPSTECAALP